MRSRSCFCNYLSIDCAPPTIQVYFSQQPPTAFVRYGRALLCFAKALIPSNSVGTDVVVTCDATDTLWYDPSVSAYRVFAGNYTLEVGQSSADASMRTAVFSVAETWNA
jgi:hypothetical protein